MAYSTKIYACLAILTILFLSTLFGGSCGRQGAIGDAQSESVAKEDRLTPEATISAKALRDDILVELTLVNHGPKAYSLLSWNLPGGGQLTTSLFQVQLNSRAVEYKGVMIKRAVTPADFIELKPGQEYRATVGLAQGYDVGPRGRYSIQYKAWNQSLDGKLVDSFASNVVLVDK